jgi:hypothetical protein
MFLDQRISRVLVPKTINSSIIPKVKWDGTMFPEKGKPNWIEASAQPSKATQFFINTLINILLSYFSRSNIKNERLRIIYAGHKIYKPLESGIYKFEGKSMISIQVFLFVDKVDGW